MDYLKKYGLSDEEISNVAKTIENANVDIDIFLYDKDRITRIIDLLKSVGINNIYEILTVNPDMFGENYNYIKKRISQYEDKEELARLINEDAMNLSIVDLY